MGIKVDISRRLFINGLLTGAAGLALSGFTAANLKDELAFYSALADSQGNYYMARISSTGKIIFKIPLPGRGHAPAVSADGQIVVMVARRPQNWLCVFDLITDSWKIIEGTEGRHFHGHGAFSADRRWFYTTENDFDHHRGVIGLYDVSKNFTKEAEFYSGGIGPHELLLSPDGEQLIVANGGILTHPDTGRSKLNLETMSPSLTFLDRKSGEVLNQYKLPSHLHQLSIRHIAVTSDNLVGIAMQYQGKQRDQLPLVAICTQKDGLQLLGCPPVILKQMRNYCGSIAFDSTEHIMAVSAPKGGLISFWSVSDGQWIDSIIVEDGCGVVTGGVKEEFILSSGTGLICSYNPINKKKLVLAQSKIRWDNHMSFSG